MDEYAKLLTSIAALVGGLVWPATLLGVIFVFRRELSSVFDMIPIMLDRVKKASMVGVALELERVANAEAESGSGKSGNVTPRQIEAAERITFQTQDINSEALLRAMDRLCLEYDSIRRTLPPGSDRTRAMTRVIVKMRSLAPALANFVDIYKGSGSAGSRLAAIAMMQMEPRIADLNWLRERFSSDQPFAFYHAALALQNVASILHTPEDKRRLRDVAQQALLVIKSFSGPPDANTVEVLEGLISSLPQQA
jgi:hypothetical protein